MLHLRFLPVILLTASIAFFGCSGSKDPERTATSTHRPSGSHQLIEPCALITEQDAKELLGEPVAEPERSEQKVVGMKLCMYNPVDSNSLNFLQITLTQQEFMPPGGLPPSEIFHSIKEAMSDEREDIEGMGDEAFIATGGLYILQNEYYISIGSGNIDRPEIRQRLKQAGVTAIGALQKLK
ncbi:MAG: hypothetical protein J7D60_01680 [Prosthecochloris sp.]|nr:hypothetical protein [Prosthecochloris sp.]